MLSRLEAESVDAIVTDPPYGIDFQGKKWDGQAIRDTAAQHHGQRLTSGEAFELWTTDWAQQALRVLKPGGHLAAFGSPRTAHRLACGIEQAGFELRDTLIWLYGTGMPKSRNLPEGRATALKPAYEPIVLARRPPLTPIAANIDRHGTGALNIDPCRVNGRFPANIAISHHTDCTTDSCASDCAVVLTDRAAGKGRAGSRTRPSRLFYCPKASRAERDAGCEHLTPTDLDLFPNARDGRPTAQARNAHPTVKPLALMRWLTRLVTPPGGLVLDPFTGSGTTGCAALLERRHFLGIERDPTYATIARTRIHHWNTTGPDDP